MARAGGGIVKAENLHPPELHRSEKRGFIDRTDCLFAAIFNRITVRKTRNLDPWRNAHPLLGRLWPTIGARPAVFRRRLA